MSDDEFNGWFDGGIMFALGVYDPGSIPGRAP